MVMKPYLLVTGDFVRTGGMDRANFALADYLARQGGEVHLVAHRVDPQLLSYSNVQFHRVPKIANSYFLIAQEDGCELLKVTLHIEYFCRQSNRR
jgi:hypothetical protein